MKTAIIKIGLLFYILFTNAYSFAQTGVNTTPAPPTPEPLFPVTFFIPFIVMAIMVCVIVYVAKRYWKYNGPTNQ